MGDDEKTPLKLNFDPKVHLDFRGVIALYTIGCDLIGEGSAPVLAMNLSRLAEAFIGQCIGKSSQRRTGKYR
jgi:hypothetical protein